MSMQQMPSEQGNRLLAALAYPIWIIALIIVLTDMKKDPFMRHHGWTALFWSIAWLVIYVAVAILAKIPFLGWLGALLLGPILWLVWLASSIYYAYQTYQGKSFTIPIVSDQAKRYAG
jgi:uncharacterized membrane protein